MCLRCAAQRAVKPLIACAIGPYQPLAHQDKTEKESGSEKESPAAAGQEVRSTLQFTGEVQSHHEWPRDLNAATVVQCDGGSGVRGPMREPSTSVEKSAWLTSLGRGRARIRS